MHIGMERSCLNRRAAIAKLRIVLAAIAIVAKAAIDRKVEAICTLDTSRLLLGSECWPWEQAYSGTLWYLTVSNTPK